MDPFTCTAPKKDGTPCGMAPGPSGFCFAHDPARAEERDEARRRGGRVRSGDLARAVLSAEEAGTLELKTAKDVHRLLVDTIQQTRTGRLEPRLSAAVGNLAAIVLRSFEQLDDEANDFLGRLVARWK